MKTLHEKKIDVLQRLVDLFEDSRTELTNDEWCKRKDLYDELAEINEQIKPNADVRNEQQPDGDYDIHVPLKFKDTKKYRVVAADSVPEDEKKEEQAMYPEGFVEWLQDKCEGFDKGWKYWISYQTDDYAFFENTKDAYQYWLNNIAKK